MKYGRRLNIDASKVKSDLKKSDLTFEQKTRLELIAHWIDGVTYIQLATKYQIHRETVAEWLRYYESEGLEGLKRPLKPIEKKILDIDELKSLLNGSGETDKIKLNALIELAKTKNTNQTAVNHNITPQGLLKWKRKFLKGEIPVSQFF